MKLGRKGPDEKNDQNNYLKFDIQVFGADLNICSACK